MSVVGVAGAAGAIDILNSRSVAILLCCILYLLGLGTDIASSYGSDSVDSDRDRVSSVVVSSLAIL